MAKLVFDEIGKRYYETGVSEAVLYPQDETGNYPKGVAWNGITSAKENPTGAEASEHYADNMLFFSITGPEKFEGTIEAFSSPKEFDACDGMAEPVKGLRAHGQARQPFGFAFKSILGNDVKGENFGYKIHLWYGCKAAPSERDYSTVNESPEPQNPSWSVKSTPAKFTGHKPVSTLTIVSTDVEPEKLKKLEDALYGTETEQAYLPLPDKVKELLS